MTLVMYEEFQCWLFFTDACQLAASFLNHHAEEWQVVFIDNLLCKLY